MGSSRGKFKVMKLIQKLFYVVALLISLSSPAFASPDFLTPEKAFRVEATWLEGSSRIELEFSPAKGYYLYQESLHFHAGSEINQLTTYKPALPMGVEKFDETFQKKLQIYKQPFIVSFDAKTALGKPIHLEVELQGCAEAGICYHR